MARTAVAGGAEVVCLARGESGSVADGARLVRADRRRSDAYDELDGEWDEVIEVAYEPSLVESALKALAERAAHWTLVSTVSVYASNDEPHADESAALVEPRDLSRYADAKVAAERASAAHVGERLLIVRPGLIVGLGDPTDRFGYWPARLSLSGPALTPTTAGRFVQVIDVADLAAWIERAGRERRTGAINAVGDVHEMKDFFSTASDVTGFDDELVTVGDDALLEQGVRYWAGPRSLPLWLPAADSAFARRSGAAFAASGGARRPLRETLARVLEDETARGRDRSRRSGLTREEEAAVLQSARRSGVARS